MELEITSKSKSPQKLRDLLETHLDWDDSYGTLRVRVPARNILADPAVVVAIVGAAGTVLGALIAGLLQIAQGEIMLQTRNGNIIKVPRGTSLENIDQLIQKLDKMRDGVDRVLLP
jgi:nitrate reductase NapAB chaperone NapD